MTDVINEDLASAACGWRPSVASAAAVTRVTIPTSGGPTLVASTGGRRSCETRFGFAVLRDRKSVMELGERTNVRPEQVQSFEESAVQLTSRT